MENILQSPIAAIGNKNYFLLMGGILIAVFTLFSFTSIKAQGAGGVGNADGSDGQPRQIMWFDVGSLTLNDGDKVETWNDISGNTHDALQPLSANRPFFVSNVINSLPVVRFDPNHETYLPFPGELLVGTDLTVIMVTARRSPTGIDGNRKMVIGGTSTSGDQNLHMGWRDATQFMANHWSNDIESNMTGGAGSGINDFGIFTNRLASTEGNPQRRLFQNNSQIGSINNSNFLSSYPGAAMGRRTSNNYFDVDIAEIIFFDEALSLPALTIVHNHLAAKYQLPLDAGQLYPHTSYTHNLIGIGTHDGQIKHSRSSGHGGALYLAEANNSLNQTNEFVFAAHNNTAQGESSTQIPPGIIDRWTRDYYIYRTQGGQQDDGNTDVRIGFDFKEAEIPATENFYYLLYRPDTSSDFTIIPGAIASVSDNRAWFTLTSENFHTGYYTVGRTDESATTWYAYRDGSWSDPDTWTTDPGGQTLIPQGSEDIPGPLDRVVILSPRTVTVDMDDIQVQALEVRSGSIIDFQATNGNSMGSISGEGRIRLRADNFPAGDASVFAAANGSTVEYYGSEDFSLSTSRSFHNMVVNLSNTSNVLTLQADYTLQGNLTIERGNLRFNNDESTSILHINIHKNLFINPSGRLSIGTGNTIGSYSLPGTMPPTGQYHSIFHQLRIGGDMHVASGAQARFSNLDHPVYNNFTTTGAVTVTFYGSSHNSLHLEGMVEFYNLIIDKGNDPTYTLEVYASEHSFFNLFGPNTAGRVNASPFSAANPEVRKALWIRNGTLKLTGSIHIPSLTEGNQAGGNGDYPVGANARMWIAGPDVRVYTTLSDNANTLEFNPNGGTGFKDNSGHTALSLYGTFRIDDGFFGTRHSAGFIFWGDASATVVINGGIVDVAQFRSAAEGTGGRTTYLQTGGHLRVRRGQEYWGEPSGGEVTGDYPIFGIIDPSGVFNMSGGEITILASSHNNDGNSYGNNGFYVLSSDFNVSGGTLNLHLNGSDNPFFIETTTNLWNLNITRRSNNNSVHVRFTRELTVANDLNIGNNSTLHPRRADGESHHDLYIGRNFVLEDSAEYISRQGGDGNTTYFTGPNDGQIVLAKTEGTAVSLFRMVVDKNSHDATLQLVSEGRVIVNISDPDIDFINLESPVELRNALIVKRGVLDYNGFPLYIGGDVTIENRSSIGIIGEPGFLLIDVAGSQQQQIITPINTQPVFGNLLIDNAGQGVMLHGGATVTIGNLGMRRGIFDIGSQGIIVEEGIVNIHHDTSLNFSATKFIRTAGKHSDGGVTRRIAENGQYLFPLGINTVTGHGNRYTPAMQEFSSVTTPGYSQVNNVDRQLPTLASSNHSALQYYWRLRNREFEETPNVVNTFDFYNMPGEYEPGSGNPNSWEPGKIVNLVRKYNLGELNWKNSHLTLTFTHQDAGMSGFAPPPLEAGEFTTGHSNRFSGEVKVFFSRLRGTSNNQLMWGETDSWTTLAQLRNHHSSYGAEVINHPELWHLSSNPASNAGTPDEGDLVVIGWVPWNDPLEEYRGDPHNIRVDNSTVSSAELIFNPMLTPEGEPAPRKYWDSYFFRPTLSLSGSANINTPIISGEGALRNRNSDPNFSNIDMGDFTVADSSYVIYEVFENPRTLNNIPEVLPNLLIVSDNWGNGDKTAIIPKDVRINGNLEIAGNTRLRLSSGTAGDLIIYGNLSLQRAIRDNTTHTNTRFEFQNENTPRTVTVYGDIYTEGTAGIYVLNPNTSVVEHTLNLYGNYIQNAQSTFGEWQPVMSLATAVDQDRVLLYALGEKNVSFEGSNTNSYLQLYNLTIDKGNSPASQINLALPITNEQGHGSFSLFAPADQAIKPIHLKNGTLIIDNDWTYIELSQGGPDFVLPSTAALILRDGWIGITQGSGSDFVLDGLLRLENAGSTVFRTNMRYTSSGHSRLEILDDNAQFWLDGQLHSRTDVETGILQFRQTGGSVFIGTNFADIPNRGVFEVFGPGSSFELTGGELTIVRGQDGSPSRAALYLNPSQYNVSPDAVINIGQENRATGTIVEINSHISLPNINVAAHDVHARLRTNALNLTGNLNITQGNSFSAQNMNLILQGNLTNFGNPNLEADTLFLKGYTQTLEGEMVVNHLVVEPQNSVALEGTNTDITVNANLHLNTGTFYEGGSTISVQKDVYNFATLHSTSTTSGGLRLAGAESQRLFGNGTFGRVEIDKTAGEVSLEGNLALENNLALTNGRLNLRNYRLTLGYDSEIILPPGEDFGTSRMIYTDGLYSDGGLAKKIPAGSGSFTFPLGIGSPQKYTPVTLNYSSNTNPGMVSISPNNSRHMTIPVGNTDVLQYHWWVSTDDLNNFSGTIRFDYDAGDVRGNAAEYIPAFLWDDPANPDFGWSKYIEEWVNEEENYFFVEFNGVSSFRGDFTAGRSIHIPDNVPLFVSRSNGSWTESTNWQHAITGEPAPNGGPSGFRVRIEPGHTITTNNNRISYRTEIQGTLNIGSTYGHNMGRISGNGTFMLEGNQLPAGNFEEFFDTQGSTIVYGGEGFYNITDRFTTLQNLTLRGSGTKSFPGENVFIRENLSIEGSATLQATLEIHLWGNLGKATTAQFLTANNTVFRGTTNQTITGEFTDQNAFYSLVMQNSQGVNVMDNIEVRNQLYLDYGVINMFNNSILRLIGNYHSSSSNNLHASWVNGKLERRLNHNTSGQLFMTGKNNKPRYVTLNSVIHGSVTDFWSVEYFDANATTQGMSTEIWDDELKNVSNVEYWQITGPSSGSAVVQLHYGPQSLVDNDPTNLETTVIAEWDGSSWCNKEGSATSSGSGFGYVTAASSSSFSEKYFTIGSTSESNPLPIELLSFTAVLVDGMVELEWVTASETNNDFFTIERSRNGHDFAVVAVIASQAENGHSTQKLSYTALDTQPLEGMSYYRLKQTDFDGSYEYSDLVGVLYQRQANVAFNLFPNPNRGNSFSIALSGLATHEALDVQILDLNGRSYYNNRHHADEGGNLQTYMVPASRLPKGVYLLRVSGRSGTFSVRMVVS